MYRIYKYDLPTLDAQILAIQAPARILSVKEQYDRIVVYALVNPEADMKEIHFRIIGTGHNIVGEELDKDFEFLNTVKLHAGKLIFHIFVERQ